MKPVFGEESGGAMHANDLQSDDDSRDKMLESVTKNLQKLGTVPKVTSSKKDDEEEIEGKEVLEDEELQDEETDDDSSTHTDDEDGDNDDDTNSEEEEEEEDEKKEDEEPAIPDGLYRAAEHNAWEPEEIAEFWKANPKLAEKTFEKMRKDEVATNTQFAEMGRTAKQLREKQDAVEAAAVAKPVTKKSFVDLDAAREEFGDAAAHVIGTLDKNLVDLNDKLQEVMASQATGKASAREAQADNQESLAVVQQMNSFFSQPSMKPYEDFYGPAMDESGVPYPDWSHLSPGQKANRVAATEQANDISSGMELRGKALSVGEALARAHTIVTDGVKESIIRNKIIASSKKRTKGITLRPSKKKAVEKKITLKPGHKMPESKVLARVNERLAKLKGKR